jgi:leader peptidase (prepilin peptidase)/N-methyltransferase
VVEFLAGALFAYVGYRWGIAAVGLVALLYISILLVTAAIDLERQLILNSIVYPAALVALALAPWGPPGQDANGWRAYLSALEGGALAFGVPLLIYILSRGGVGEGDVKLGAFLGLALGFRGALVALPLSFVIGGLWAIALLVSRRKRLHDIIPYGVWMALGSIVSLFWGEVILDWYRGLFGF